MTKLIPALAAMASFYFGGCESVPPEATTNSENTFTLGNSIDYDQDGHADIGLPGGDVQLVIRQSCSAAPNDNLEELCIMQLSGALHGTGDCRWNTQDDPTVCRDGGLDCSKSKYSTCALCINPGATEVCDGVDNDCDGQKDEGLSGSGCCQVDSDCPSGQECGDNNTCVPVTCVPQDNCHTAAIVNGTCVQTEKQSCCLTSSECPDVQICTPSNTCQGIPCEDDGDPCTSEAVVGHVCTHPVKTPTNDNNECTLDTCGEDGMEHTPIPGCAQQCDPRNDAQGEDHGDCAAYRNPNLGSQYGWGCIPTGTSTTQGTCGAYEDKDNDEWADVPETFCSDGIDGDLDGNTDHADSDCSTQPECTTANAADNCDDSDGCSTDSCNASGKCVNTFTDLTCVSCTSNANCSGGKICGQNGTCVAPPTQNLCVNVTCGSTEVCDAGKCIASNKKVWCWDSGNPRSCHTHGAGYYSPETLWTFAGYPTQPPPCQGPTGSQVFYPLAMCCVSDATGLDECEGAVWNPYAQMTPAN